MNRLILTLILLTGYFASVGQQVYTIRLLDAESNQPVKEAMVAYKGKQLPANHLGFVQFEAKAGDTLVIEHKDYEPASLIAPAGNSFMVKLTKKAEKLGCHWMAINFMAGDYYYGEIKISEATTEDYEAYVILSKKKRAYFVIKSADPKVLDHKTLRIETKAYATDFPTWESRKKSFPIISDRKVRAHYLTIGEMEKEGTYFNLFEVSNQQINEIKRQADKTVKTIKLGDGLVFNLTDLIGRKIGNMFSCIE